MADEAEQGGLRILGDVLSAAHSAGDLSCLSPDLLARIADAFHLQRVSLFQVHEAEGRGIAATCVIDWRRPGLAFPAMTEGSHPPLTAAGGDPLLAQWAARRRRGETIIGRTRDLTGYLYGFFSHYGVVTFLTEPVMVHGRWWGHFCVDTPDAEHEWTAVERQAFKCIAAVLAGLLARSGTEGLVSEAARRAMLDTSIDAVIVADEAGAIVEFNHAAEAIFGHTREAVIGRPMTETIIPAHYIDRHRQGFMRHLATGENHIMRRLVEVEALRADGSVFPAELTVNEHRAGGRRLFSAFVRDISDRITSRRALERLAFTDMHTGLSNRTGLLRLCTGRPTRPSGAVVLMLRDLGVVKTSFGDDWAEPMIVETANLLSRMLPQEACLGRTGESEFTVVTWQPGAAAELAETLIGRLRSAIESGGRRFYLRVGLGVVERPGDATYLLRDAEMAARDCRDGHLLHFAEHMRAQHQQRLELEMALRDVIQRRTSALSLHYQPVVSARTGGLVGFEALVRWYSETHGPVSPALFVPLAEAGGFAERLGAWVIETAISACAGWNVRRRAHGLAPWHIAINLSATEVVAPDLIERVRQTMAFHGLPPQCVCFELTESAILNQPEIAIETLSRLRALGCTTAIDDFGTGYSSLSYLQRLPMDVLKIDRSFVLDMVDNSRSREIVRVMIEMAHGLGMSVVAEGVETTGALQILRQMGCDRAQGFLFGRAMPGDVAGTLPETLAPTG
ncbi:PAS domain S-box-containing protein [Azorhizobium sp. AG788]|uniref:putative bifunctional diguanylate cyclase/phosphodiesterase n=1 Tax=Azorhizobium sp. AG788 TaxID=2183897 RepID=UPI00105FFAF8|nr:EAL domain-containing protein [Azorhizobium sp. AG788]TDT93538.1 PAS domain S-box-containing protein [Azorhizobium sp. AG788]